MKIIYDKCGQVMIPAALCLVVLLGCLGLAVDVGTLYRAKEVAQTAADSGAVAAAIELPFGDATAAARADAALNGVTNGTNGATVTVNNPPLSGPNAGNASYVEVIASISQPRTFMSILDIGSTTVSARAVATLGITSNCIYALKPTGTAISASNGVTVKISGCAVFANSSSSTSLQVTGGANFAAASINLVGNYSVSNGGQLTPSTPSTGVTPISDPLGYLAPPSFIASSCVANPNLGWGTSTIGPTSGGTICYNGLTIANGGTATLRPGTYIINGVMSLAGGTTTTGSGVTIYLPPGASLSISNGITFALTAPASGTYNGILFYQDRSNSNGIARLSVESSGSQITHFTTLFSL